MGYSSSKRGTFSWSKSKLVSPIHVRSIITCERAVREPLESLKSRYNAGSVQARRGGAGWGGGIKSPQISLVYTSYGYGYGYGCRLQVAGCGCGCGHLVPRVDLQPELGEVQEVPARSDGDAHHIVDLHPRGGGGRG